MKKIAKFVFGDENVSFRKTDNKRYFIFLEKKRYHDKKELVESFENYWNVDVRPIDL
jgi:hypothetical protein